MNTSSLAASCPTFRILLGQLPQNAIGLFLPIKRQKATRGVSEYSHPSKRAIKAYRRSRKLSHMRIYAPKKWPVHDRAGQGGLLTRLDQICKLIERFAQ